MIFRAIRAIFSHVLAFARGETKLSPCWLLVPFGWIYSLSTATRNFFYDHGILKSVEPSLPVISVGNLTIGGTNKTPFVEMLCRMLGGEGRVKVGIVSRGYGGTGKNSPVVIVRGQGEREIVGDEPLLLSSRLPDVPVAVSRDRLDDVQSLSPLGVELVVADDAFQHRKLGRDVDIVLIDALCPFGNGTLLPSGILRETQSSLKRAHIVVITKSDQISPNSLFELRQKIEKIVPREKIFTSRIVLDRWMKFGKNPQNENFRNENYFLPFSAIGNPESFHRSLASAGVKTLTPRIFRDHHRYTVTEMNELVSEAESKNASLVCTEKDIYNLPKGFITKIPIWVPIVSTVLDEPERFRAALIECLRPHIVVASNGYGEDAVGVVLAQKLREKFGGAEISIFPLVGRGDAYLQKNFEIYPEPSITPSGGVIKYHLRDLWRDLRSGLLKHISAQMKSWGNLRGHIRTPLCVGDVYLLFHSLYGQGLTPLFMATAKTVFLSGHWRSEKFFIRARARMTWTRDAETARELTESGAKAIFAGNPIMDLASLSEGGGAEGDGGRILLLPGSRDRAYQDVFLLLDAAAILHSKMSGLEFFMVIAPTLDAEKIRASIDPAKHPPIEITTESIAAAATRARVVIGLGGTANQVCAGFGVPVVSIEEKGKFVQKKLLGDAEILVPPTPEALAEMTFKILNDSELHSRMAQAGRERMGSAGAIENMARYAEHELGWGLRYRVWEILKGDN